MSDPIDRSVYLSRGGKPHIANLAHLTETHNCVSTAHYLYQGLARGEKDADFAPICCAVRDQRDTDPDSPTYGCLKWYLQDPAIGDTNASFFICLPLALAWLMHREKLTAEETEALRSLFAAVAPWFARMADSPSLYYPNKCLGDVAMLLVTGHILEDEALSARARDFCRRFLDYVDRRGMGWGEDHSPVYTRVIAEMGLLIMHLEQRGELHDRTRAMIDGLMEWAAFHDGLDAVPSIRGYNFACDIEVKWGLRQLLAGAEVEDENAPLAVLARATGYSYTPAPQPLPRSRRQRTFDEHYSVSYIGAHARLGTLSHYPIMPDTYMHDGWGLAWQSKPASLIVGREDYGVLEWATVDDEGTPRQHEAAGTIWDYASRHLFKRVAFHPEVVFAAHQQAGAAIIFREIHQLHSPTVSLEDRWRLAHGGGRVLIGGEEWSGQAGVPAPPDWIVLDYGGCAVALYPLQCRVLDMAEDDPNPQRREQGNIVSLRPRLERTDRGLHVSLPLIAEDRGVITQPLLFSGWCVALLDDPAQVAELRVQETFREDGELPRPYGELIRTVELTSPYGVLRFERDMLSGVERRWTDGETVM
jgi:hypothetical protein